MYVSIIQLLSCQQVHHSVHCLHHNVWDILWYIFSSFHPCIVWGSIHIGDKFPQLQGENSKALVFWNYKFSCLLLGKPQVQIHPVLWFLQWKSKSKWPKKEIAFFLTIAYLLLPTFGSKLGLQCENMLFYQCNQFLQEHMWIATDFL